MIMIPPASTRSFLGFNALHFKPSRHHQAAWYINTSPLMPSISVSGYRLCGLFHCFSHKKASEIESISGLLCRKLLWISFLDYLMLRLRCHFFLSSWENPIFQLPVLLLFMPCTTNTHRSLVWEAMITRVEFLWQFIIHETTLSHEQRKFVEKHLESHKLMLFGFLA